jgi:hypothetical protein
MCESFFPLTASAGGSGVVRVAQGEEVVAEVVGDELA